MKEQARRQHKKASKQQPTGKSPQAASHKPAGHQPKSEVSSRRICSLPLLPCLLLASLLDCQLLRSKQQPTANSINHGYVHSQQPVGSQEGSRQAARQPAGCLKLPST